MCLRVSTKEINEWRIQLWKTSLTRKL
jgi:hypothetical protein